MKSLLLSFLVGLAVASNAVYEQAYRSRQEYVYKYESQISTGLIHASRQQAGFKMSTTARLQFVTQTAVRVRFEHTVLYKIDQPVVQIDPQVHTLPNDFLREWWAPEVANIINYLETPFGFKYSNGHVLQIALTKDEPEWSANAKRGFMALFEMNLEKRMMLDQHVTPKSSPNTLDMYTVFEQCPTGDCATMYTVHPVAEKGEVQTGAMHVEKVRDYDRCLEAPIYFKSPFGGQNIADQVNANPLSRQASIDYAIRGSNDQFIIMSAMAQERIVFSPSYNPETPEEIRTSVNQTLVLVSAAKMTTEIPEVQADLQKQCICMAMPTNISRPFQPATEQPEEKAFNPYSTYTAEKIVAHLKMAAQNTEYLTSKESLVHMRVVTEMMRTSCVHELRKVFNILAKQDTTPELMRFATEIFINTAPVVGTEAAARVILDICSEGTSTYTDSCSNAVSALALYSQPTPRVIKQLVQWIKKAQRGTPDVLRQKQYLALGSFAFRLGAMRRQEWEQMTIAETMLQRLMTDNRKYIRQMVQQKKQYLDEKKKNTELIFNEMGHTIVEMFEPLLASANVADKNLALKALGNAGLPQSVPVLRRFLTTEQCDYYKVMAIRALWRIRDPVAVKEVRGILMNIFMNKQENQAARNAAFVVLTSMGLDLPLMEKIVNMMHSEKDAHVSNLVMSFLQTVANSTYQPMQRMSYMAATAIKSAPFYNVDMEHSFTRFWGQYSQQHRMGGAMAVRTLGQMDKFMGAYFNFDSDMYGICNSKNLEFAFQSENLAQFFSKIGGPRGLLASGLSMFNTLKNNPSASPQDFIQRIVKTLNIKPRAFELPKGDFSINLMGNELRYWDVTSVLRSLVTGGKLPISFTNTELRADLPVNYQNLLNLFDVKMQLPTEAGFPVGLQAQLGVAAKVQGDLSFVMPIESRGNAPNHIAIKADIKPKAVVGLYASMGLDHFFVKPSVGFYGLVKADFPIRKDVTFDFTSEQFQAQIGVFMEDTLKTKPVVETIVEPITEFIEMNPQNPSTPVMSVNVQPIYMSAGQRIMPIAQRAPMNLLGYELEITGQSPIQWYPFCPFRGRTAFNIYVKPMANAPSKININAALNFNAQPKTSTFDKFGREQPVTQQLPRSVLDVVEQVQQHSDKPSPVSVPMHEYQASLWFNLQANAGSVVRNFSAAVITGPDSKHTHDRTCRFIRTTMFRSPIPGDNQPWTFDGILKVMLPARVYEPEEIYSVGWQKELLSQLNYHIALDSTKVVNRFLNMTINSVLQQLNFGAMRQVPASRVLDGIIPEHLIRMMKPELITETSRNWQTWFSKIQPLFEMVQEERKQLVDPEFTNKDAVILGYLQQLQEIQQPLAAELQAIVEARTMMHREVPVMQWVVMRQAEILAALKEIVVRYEANGAITRIAAIKERLGPCVHYAEIMCEKAKTIMTNVRFTLTETELPSGSPVALLHQRLRTLSLAQVQEIRSLYEVINKGQNINVASIMKLISASRNTVTYLDDVMGKNLLHDETVIEAVMLVTVQNEFIIQLCQSYFVAQSTRVAGPTSAQTTQERRCDELLKWISFDLGQRTAFLYQSRDMANIVAPKLTKEEMTAWTSITLVKGNLLAAQRLFQMEFAGNTTALRDPATTKYIVEKYISAIDYYINYVTKAIQDIRQLPQAPTIYLTADILQAANGLKKCAELGRDALVGLAYNARLPFIHEFDERVTQIQSVIASLAPVFERYNVAVAHPVLPYTPVALSHPHIANVYYVIRHQAQIIKHLSKFIQDPTVKAEILQQVLVTVLDKSVGFQTALQQAVTAHQQQLQNAQKPESESTIVASLFTQAIKQQKSIYSIVSSVFQVRTTKLHNIPEMTRKVQSLQQVLSDLEVKTATYYQLPEGFFAQFSAQWGYRSDLKTMCTTAFATRSVEQIYWMYSQLNAVVRSQELVQAVNKQMSHQTWDAANVKDMLNTYNHVHWIVNFKPDAVPMWLTQFLTSLQENIKYSWWNHYTRDVAPASFNGQLQSIVEYSDLNNKLDMTLLTKNEANLFLNVPVAKYLKIVDLNLSTRSPYTQASDYLSGGRSPVCMIHQDKVSTFDTVSYQLPYTKDYCKQLLAMDCSSDNSFAVTAKPSSIVSGAHILEIAGAGKVITVTPAHLDLQVLIDQQIVTLEDNRPVVFPGVVMVKRGLSVEVKLPETGLYVMVDGHLISIATTHLFHNKICGLCSNFDTQKSWEFEGPSQKMYPDARSFAMSYLIPDSSCPATYKHKSFVPVPVPVPSFVVSDYSSVPSPTDMCTLEQKTHVRVFKNVVCFSQQPISKCSFECADVEQQEKRKIKYNCFSKSHPLVQTMRDTAEERLLSPSELRGYKAVKTRRVNVDTVCKPE